MRRRSSAHVAVAARSGLAAVDSCAGVLRRHVDWENEDRPRHNEMRRGGGRLRHLLEHKVALTWLDDVIGPGSLVIFDDWYAYGDDERSWLDGQKRAMKEYEQTRAGCSGSCFVTPKDCAAV